MEIGFRFAALPSRNGLPWPAVVEIVALDDPGRSRRASGSEWRNERTETSQRFGTSGKASAAALRARPARRAGAPRAASTSGRRPGSPPRVEPRTLATRRLLARRGNGSLVVHRPPPERRARARAKYDHHRVQLDGNEERPGVGLVVRPKVSSSGAEIMWRANWAAPGALIFAATAPTSRTRPASVGGTSGRRPRALLDLPKWSPWCGSAQPAPYPGRRRTGTAARSARAAPTARASGSSLAVSRLARRGRQPGPARDERGADEQSRFGPRRRLAAPGAGDRSVRPTR